MDVSAEELLSFHALPIEEHHLELVSYGVFYCHDGNFSVDTSYEQVNKHYHGRLTSYYVHFSSFEKKTTTKSDGLVIRPKIWCHNKLQCLNKLVRTYSSLGHDFGCNLCANTRVLLSQGAEC